MSVQDVFAAPKAVVGDVVNGSGAVSASIMQSMTKTRPWVLLFAVLGFIGAGLMLIGSVGAIVGGITMLNVSAGDAPSKAGLGGLLAVGLFYLVITALYFWVSLYLLRYASAIKRLKLSNQLVDLEAALANQASFWKLVGIMVLISVVVSIVIIIVMPSLLILFAGMQNLN